MLSVVRVILYTIHFTIHLTENQTKIYKTRLNYLRSADEENRKKCLFFLVGTVIIIIIANRPIKTNIENVDNDVCEYIFSTRIVCVVMYLNVANSFIF